MSGIVKLLIVASVVGFVLAVVASYTGTIAGVTAEGFSRGCTNLALVAIALGTSWKPRATG
ncbi:MAG: hypothetical protein OEO21_05010 [Candidatus Krumholzibacteria bacterium]|nr:hypothetical protein [Candidatus Krumholzibacteria bacterium]